MRGCHVSEMARRNRMSHVSSSVSTHVLPALIVAGRPT